MWINAAIHTFTPFNMADGSTRWRYTAAYTVEAIEAIARSGSVTVSLNKVKLLAIRRCFAYYRAFGDDHLLLFGFHPNRRRHLRIPAAEDENLQS
ncbi:hypothetical protein OSTOST_26175, partial [Ostertagia ostertagi]